MTKNPYLEKMPDATKSARDSVAYAMRGIEDGKCTEPEARAALLAFYRPLLERTRAAVTRRGKSPFRLLAARASGEYRKLIEALEADTPIGKIYPNQTP